MTFHIFTCRRGEIDRRPYCQCDMRATKGFVLGGRMAGKTCNTPICAKCASPSGDGTARAYCLAHAIQADAWDPTLVPRRTS